ncbi:MAG: TonB-dependent receptor [Halieaceae bacterium]|jgi:iron complex outermembrane recepter protein|nr:TonB-dependent receptor [Halieaceae bacterium]
MNRADTVFSKNPLAAALAFTSLVLVAAPATWAQDLQLEEVMVTARKAFESGQDVPVAVSAFSGESIDALIMRDIREMEGLVPNLVISSVSVAPGGASIYLRGVGTQDVERSFDPAVGVVIDGVSLSYINGSMANTFDFGSLEVLRGPQGTLFGRNTTGGVINIKRTRPTGELGLRYELVAGSDDKQDVRGVLNFPIVEDVLAGKLGYASMRDGGQMKNTVNGDRVGDYDNQEITATLLWTPSDNFEALFTYSNYEDKNDGVPLKNRSEIPEFACLFGFCDDNKMDVVGQDFLQDINFEVDAYSLEMNWKLPLGTLTSVTGYRDTDETVPSDLDATPIPLLHVLRDQQSEQTSTELRFASNDELSENFDFVVGVYYLEDNYQSEQMSAILEFLGPAAVYQNPHTDHERETWSVFGEAHIALNERWNLTVGGRYSYEEKDITADLFMSFGTPDGMFPAGYVEADEDWSEFTPKIGLDYRVNDDVLLYGSYSEGFRSGGFNGRNSSPADIGPYDPEFVEQFELGMKGDFLDRRLRLNLAAFFTDYKDKQEEIILPDGFGGTLTVVENASTADIWGLEGELIWVASENLIINANFGYLDAEYDSYVADINGDGVETDNSDLIMRRTPEWTGGISGNYSRDMGPGVLRAFLGYRYTDEHQVEVGNDPRGLLDDRGVVDANLSYEWEWAADRTVKITAYGRDLTDERDFSAAIVVPPLFTFASVSGGRQYGVQISGNF